jgi:hypothetical protein
MSPGGLPIANCQLAISNPRVISDLQLNNTDNGGTSLTNRVLVQFQVD